jgi:hypothetical protein
MNSTVYRFQICWVKTVSARDSKENSTKMTVVSSLKKLVSDTSRYSYLIIRDIIHFSLFLLSWYYFIGTNMAVGSSQLLYFYTDLRLRPRHWGYLSWPTFFLIFFRRGFESLQTRASRQPLTVKALFRSQVNPYVTSNKVALRQISEYVGFSPVSIIPPMVYTRLNLQVCCYKEVKWLKLRNLPTGSALSIIWQHWVEKDFHISIECWLC